MVKISGKVAIVVVATGTTALCIIIGAVFILFGDVTKNPDIHQDGWNLIGIGIAIPVISTGLAFLKKRFS